MAGQMQVPDVGHAKIHLFVSTSGTKRAAEAVTAVESDKPVDAGA